MVRIFLSASGLLGTVASCDTWFRLSYRPSEIPDRRTRPRDTEYEALKHHYTVEEELRGIIFLVFLVFFNVK